MKLLESFKNECKAKGYSQSSNDEVSNLNEYNLHPGFSINRKRRRRAKSFTIEGDGVTGGNETYKFQLDVDGDDLFDDIGQFHEPAKLPNISLEAMCGNISIK